LTVCIRFPYGYEEMKLLLRSAFPYILLLLLCSGFALHGQTADTEYHIREDMNNVSSFYPRTVNSAGEEQVFDYIRAELRESGAAFTTYDFTAYSSIHSFSSAVEAVFPGAGQDTLFFIVPVSHPPDSPENRDGSAGIALGLALCRQLAESPADIETRVLFLGADFGGRADYSRGSRAFLEKYYSSGQSAFVYLHYPTPPSATEIIPASTGEVTPYWLVEGMASRLREAGTPPHFDLISFQLYRLGLNDEPTPIHPYLNAGYPALYLTGGSAGDQSQPAGAEEGAATLRRVADALQQSTHSLGPELPRTWDRHYQYLSLENRSLRITQLQYVLGLLALFALVLLYPFLRAKHFLKYGRSIIRNAGALPLLYLLMFIYLYLATLLLEGVTLIQSYSLWWQDRPLLFILLKLSAAGFLFFLTQRAVHRVGFTRVRGSFYSASALVFFLADIIILSAIDLTLSLYGAAVFLFAFLFSVTAHRMLKLALLLLALTATAVPLYLVFSSGMYTAIRPLLLSRTTGNLLIAFHFLPFMLLLIRVRMLFHHPNPRITRRVIYAFDLLFGGLTLTFFSLLVFSTPFGPHNPQLIEVREQQKSGEAYSRMVIESRAPLGSFTLRRGDEQLSIRSQRRSVTRTVPQQGDLLTGSLAKEVFLNRALYTLTLDAQHPPQWIRVRLTTPGDIVLYESRFPAVYEPDRSAVRFRIGRNPPLPLEVRFTLPAAFTGTAEIQAEYGQPPVPLEVQGKAVRLNYQLIIDHQFTLGGEG
jgi:hypothetical protein